MGVMVAAARRSMLVFVSLLSVLAGGLAFGGVQALAERGHVFEKAFGSAGSGDGQLSEPQGVAVNEASDDVYVSDRGNHRVEQFSSSGTFVAVWGWGVSDGVAEFEVCTSGCQAGLAGSGEGQVSSPEGIAVDNDPSSPSYGDLYVVDAGKEVVEKFTANGTYINTVKGTSGGLYGVAVDKQGQLWVYDEPSFFQIIAANFTNEVSNVFVANRTLEGFSVTSTPGFAVDSEDNLYAGRRISGGEEIISKFDSQGKTLNSRLNEEPSSSVTVELSSDDAYVDYKTAVVRFASTGEQIEQIGAGKLVGGAGMGVDASTESIYVADSSANAIIIFSPEPVSQPVIKTESIAAVTGNSATLKAEISPQGKSTTYHFEYGPCTSLATCANSGYKETLPTPDIAIGSGWQVQSVSIHVQDLHPGTAYHFRLVAANELGGGYGESSAFRTQALNGPLQLADNRQWEMVSPPTKEGALFSPILEGIIQASANGNAMAYLASNPTEAEPQGYSNQVSVFSIRGSSNWTSQVIAPPHDEGTFVSLGFGQEYRLFSEDLSYGVVQPFGKKIVPLSPEATETTPYLHSDYMAGDVSQHCRVECFKPLVTGANVPAGTEFGQICETVLICGPLVVGATPDASHVLLKSQVALTSIPTPEHGGLYEWGAGQLRLVSVLPEGETNTQDGVAAASPQFGQDNEAARNAISTDGSRVIWKGTTNSHRHLYMRDMEKRMTIRLDIFQGVPTGGESNEPIYMTASIDETRIFFLDSEKLTAQSSSQGRDLYEYNLDAPEGSRLTDLSVTGNSAESASVANVLGASSDGSYIYFAAGGALAPGAHSGRCEGSDVAKSCNLYVSHDGVTRLIAGLSSNDYPSWAGGDPVGSVTAMASRVSSNGRWLSFVSQRNLAGYDMRDAVNGVADEEVYLYDASTGRLACASCNPTGARPVGQEYGSGMELVGVDGGWSPTAQLASLVPPWTRLSITEARYQSRYLSDSGRMFFDSHDALVPQDVNGTWDVYEYEPVGVGDCTSAAATFSEASNGCVSLISSGTSNEESAFLDASEDGSDVFFLTTASLQPQDYDHARDVYDAHACSSQAPCFAPAPVPPPTCDTGESCKAAQSAQPSIFGPGPSQTFSGVGNLTSTSKATGKSLSRAQRLARALKACRHIRGKRKRAACRRRARRRYGRVGANGARSVGVNGSTRGVSIRTGR